MLIFSNSLFKFNIFKKKYYFVAELWMNRHETNLTAQEWELEASDLRRELDIICSGASVFETSFFKGFRGDWKIENCPKNYLTHEKEREWWLFFRYLEAP